MFGSIWFFGSLNEMLNASVNENENRRMLWTKYIIEEKEVVGMGVLC